jgi:23S rRNA (uridine2479-2'-O)-methyltransferase
VEIQRVTKRDSAFQVIQALKTNRSKRNELKEVFVEGIACIKNAARAGMDFKKIIFREYDALSGWGKGFIADKPGASLFSFEEALYGEICDKGEPSEIVATVEKEVLELRDAKLSEAPFIVVVDRPSSHGNLGSMIRSANAFGVDLLVTLGHGVDLFDPAVIRASIGGVFFRGACHEPSMKALSDWIDGLRKRYPRMAVIGTDSKAETPLPEDPGISRPAILLIGNEAKGLSVELKRVADKMTRIPMSGEMDSLNVACAASIAMYVIAGRNARSSPSLP